MNNEFVCGTEFVYANRKLGPSREVSKQEAARIPVGKQNAQEDFPLYVKCGRCGVYMDYIPKADAFGKWRCPVCGVGVRETTAYDKLDREIEEEKDFLAREYGYEDDWT